MDKVYAIIPAAGQGKRMNSPLNKQFMLLQGMPIIAHTLKVFQEAAVISEIILVCAPGEEEYYRAGFLSTYGISKPTTVVTGGRERQDSVNAGLACIEARRGYVLIHDGARPLVTVGLIISLVDAVAVHGAVVAGVPVKDTIKRTDAAGVIIDTLPREELWQIQTPQAFRLGIIRKAHAEAASAGHWATDDAALVERMGFPVRIIPGSYENIKITTPEDMVVAEAVIKGRGRK